MNDPNQLIEIDLPADFQLPTEEDINRHHEERIMGNLQESARKSKPTDPLERIAIALERIADALETKGNL